MFSAAGPINQFNASEFPPDPGTASETAGIIGETDIIGYSPSVDAILCWTGALAGVLRKYDIASGTVTATIGSNAGIPGGMDIVREEAGSVWYSTHSSGGSLEHIDLDPTGSMSVTTYGGGPPNSSGAFTYVPASSSIVDSFNGSLFKAGTPINADNMMSFRIDTQASFTRASGVGQSNTPSHVHWDEYRDRILWFKGNVMRQFAGGASWSTLGTTASSGDKAYGGMASTPDDGTYFTYGTDDGDSHIAHVSAGGTVTDNLYTTAADTMWLGCGYHPLWNKVFLLSQDNWDQASVTLTWHWFTPNGTSISVETMTAGTQINSDAFNNNQKITGLAIVPTRLEVWGLAHSASANTSKLLKLTP